MTVGLFQRQSEMNSRGRMSFCMDCAALWALHSDEKNFRARFPAYLD